MPKFGNQVEIRLGTVSLKHSTTTNSATFGIGKGTSDIEKHESSLAQANHLVERPIKDGSSFVRYLGDPALSPRPFFLVRAGPIWQNQSGKKYRGTRRDTLNPVPNSNVDGLALSVKLDKKLFEAGPKVTLTDVKVEVFYNGQFNCAKINHARDNLHGLLFGGQRVELSIERPWILRNSLAESVTGKTVEQQFAHHLVTHHGRPQSVTGMTDEQRYDAYQSRWNLVKQSLKDEADRRGVDDRNRPSPIKQYLDALSDLAFPDALAYDNNPMLAANMGIIDVVVSLGHGKKDVNDREYAYGPVRMSDPRHARMANRSESLSNLFSSTENESSQTTLTSSQQSVWSSASGVGESSSTSQEASSSPLPLSRAGLACKAGLSNTGKLQSRLTVLDQKDPKVISSKNWDDPASLPESSTLRNDPSPTRPMILRKDPKPSIKLRLRRSKSSTETTGTASSTTASSQGPTLFPVPGNTTQLTNPRKRRRIDTKTTDTQPSPTFLLVNRSDETAGFVDPTKDTQVSPTHWITQSSTSAKTPAKTISSTPETNKPFFPPPSSVSPTLQGKPRSTAPSTSPSRNSPSKPKRKTSDTIRRTYDWQVPELSKDCVAGYAVEGMVEDNVGDEKGDIMPGLCRQVRKERSGEFDEDCVLVGARFVVG